MTDRTDPSHSPERRALLAGGLGAGVAAVAACAAPSTGASASAASSRTPAKATTAKLALTPQTTEGPYYFDAKKVRADITEGLPGIPLDVEFHVVDASGRELADTRVDIWHCNAAGLYSGYAGQGDDHGVSTKGQTFLRGTQTTDASGIARFQSIYPGWYRGRTTHIHFKVIRGDAHVLTSQFTLPDALSEFLYTEIDAYRRAELRDTLNSNDGIALQAGESLHGSVRENADRYVARLEVVVDPNARPTIDRPPVPGEGMPPGPPPVGMQRPPGAAGPEGGPMRPAPMTEEARRAALVPQKGRTPAKPVR